MFIKAWVQSKIYHQRIIKIVPPQSCESRCGKQMRHTGEHTSASGKRCIFSVQYENKIYTCQKCQVNHSQIQFSFTNINFFVCRKTVESVWLYQKQPRPRKDQLWVWQSLPGRALSSNVRNVEWYTGTKKNQFSFKECIYFLPSRSRQQWYGNTDPEHQGVVHTEIAHVWPGVSGLVYSSEDFSQVSPAQEFCVVWPYPPSLQ